MSRVQKNTMIFLHGQEVYSRSEQQKIDELREKVENCHELQVGTEEVLLTKYLTFTNWDVERAYEAIHNYYEFKLFHPTWVAQNPVDFFRTQFFEAQCKFVMPHSDKNGRAVVVFKTVDLFEKFPNYMQDLIEMDDLIYESLLTLPAVQRNGITVICDLKNASKRFLRMLTPSFIKVVNYKHEVLPFKMRVMHIIQRGFIMSATSSLLMPLMSKGFKDTLFVHDGKNLAKLREMIGHEYLPAEYGGPCENVLDVNLIYNHLMQKSQYLEKLQNYQKIYTPA